MKKVLTPSLKDGKLKMSVITDNHESAYRSIDTERLNMKNPKRTKDTNMETIQKKMTKSVETLSGDKIKRVAQVKLLNFASAEEVKNALGENLEAFAALGYRTLCKAKAAANLGGSGKKEKTLKAAIRNFKAAIDVAVTHLDMPKEVAIETFLNKESFSVVKTYFEDLAKNNETLTFDFTVNMPELAGFGETDDEDDEDDATE